jgi:hypothetical protein
MLNIRFTGMQLKNTILLFILLAFAACEKDEGRGGNSSIIGNVHVREWSDPAFSALLSEHAGFDEKVYIIYGDETGVGDNADTGPDGNYEFKFLRKGKYKIFVISDDSVHATPFYVPDTVFTKEVEITDKKQTVNAGTFTIYKITN